MKPFFTYFGGKYRAAPKYPEPLHDTIIEPFAGSAGYSVRHNAKRVILNDLDEKVAGTWEYLIQASSEEIMKLPLYDGSWEMVNDLSIPQEARWLIGWWLGKGSAHPRLRPTSWMKSGSRPNSYWGESIRSRIASQVDSIRHWEISSIDYRDMEDVVGTWFIDPPYQVAGKEYSKGASGIDYDALGDWCRRRPGQTIVCENEGADWLPFRFLGDIKASPGRVRSGVSTEAIWTQRDAPMGNMKVRKVG